MGSDSKKRISDFVNFNPQRSLKKGANAPFIDMASLPINNRDILEISEREFTGGGSRFCNGDTLFARITPCLENGKTAKVTHLPKNAIGFGSTEFIVMSAIEPEFDENYVYYLCRLPEFRAFAQVRMQGTSGRQRVSWQSLSDFEFNFPDKYQRKIIGGYLQNIDDKIELNRQMNATLEAMVQALFKSWFVDFDPVIDNALAAGNPIPEPLQARAEIRKALGDQRKPLPDVLQQQFPDRFILDEEMGWIPEGWYSGPVSQLCLKVQNGGTPRRDNTEYWNDGTIPWLTSGEVRQTIITSVENKITESGLKNSSAKWLPAGSTVIAMYGATAGQVAFVATPITTNQAVCGLIPKEDYRFFNYLSLERVVASLENQARGSAQQNISKGIIENTTIIIPSTILAEILENQVEGYFEKWFRNLDVENTLTKIRDTLLPKLLSGELRVPEAEALIDKQLVEA